MAKNTLSLLLVGGGALLVAAKSKKKKKKSSASATKPSVDESTPDDPAPEEPGHPADEPGVGMGNPAALFCQENGGSYVVRQDVKGNQSGACVMPDGTEVPEWPFTRGEMSPGPAVDGLEAQGKVVVSKVGQAVTISLEEDAPTSGNPISYWQMAADSELKPERVLIDLQTKVPAQARYRRHFTFWTDKPGMGRAMFERVAARGAVEQVSTVTIETVEE
jgi:putative hemolysin